MSQLDLALAADVSSRHVSFLETGRAQPSREMVLRLAANLNVPFREQNAMLRAAGFEDAFEQPSIDRELEPSIAFALERMLAQHEPLPMMVLNRRYEILRMNRGAAGLAQFFVKEPSALTVPINAFHLVFNPELVREFVVDWRRMGRIFLSRLHRESLLRPEDPSLRGLVEELLEYPDVPPEWRQPDFSAPNVATYRVRLRRNDLELCFLTTLTVFSAPHNITLEELQLESYFALDEATEAACRRFAQVGLT